MLTRVTAQTRMTTASLNLQSSAAQLARLQNTASSLKKIAVPSDDPAGTADSMRVRVAQSATAQYGRNIDDGGNWLTTIDSAMSASTAILNKVRDLTVQGANDGSLSVTAKEAIAKELEGLRSDLLAQANTTYLGRTVFAGDSDTGVAFTGTPAAYTFTGTGSPVQRPIAPNTTVQVDADGAAVFGTGGSSVFALVDNIVADLRAGVNIGSRIGAIDDATTAVVSAQSSVGARASQITKAKDANLQTSGALEAQRSDIEDVDLSQIIIQLKQQEVTYQAALAITSRTLQPTLMDFLR
ncbi:flagellar hook-associated protein FlgL [Glaciihabitans sp. UYNi722]|uniref:flagellar hook-associated protein FlgL n=1 Tax=Glaciihabitans sp. UYNi722 TaxID=3156344 RepID=UPI0033923F69